ncbi:MAG: GNAT family N-acetyltransferase [Rhodospirillales bacterium]|nr:GNAT family N-acetyltransferase [Rhodospirillales bacterium]
MAKPAIEVSDVVAPDAQAAISAGLNAFNDAFVGYTDRKPLAVVARDPATGAVLGGALGRSSLGLAFLDLFYLEKAQRGDRLGSTILRMFEAEAARRGCIAAVLYTLSFQAPGFYEKNGWTRFGEVACLPEGTQRVFLTKRLGGG